MLGVVYLLLAAIVGYFILTTCFSRVLTAFKSENLFGAPISLPSWLIVLPGSYLIGTIVVTWVTYFCGYLFQASVHPLLGGNILAYLVMIAFIGVFCYKQKVALASSIKEYRSGCLGNLRQFCRENRWDILYSLVALLLCIYLIPLSLYAKDGAFLAPHGGSGDIHTHLSLMRSFSVGANFPTNYPNFANGFINYYFLPDFLCGNLEFLGMRLDYAFNLPSILSYTSFMMLFYVLSYVITGKRVVGWLALVLFLFRSSFSVFPYLSDLSYFKYMADLGMPPLGNFFSEVFHNTKFLGKTQYEDWGLWTMAVYVCQRSLGFAIGVLMLVLLDVLPLYREALRLSSSGIRQLWTERDAWLPLNPWNAVCLGFLLGATSFWNLFVVFTALILLFCLALFSRHKGEFLIIAGITAVLTLLEKNFFVGPGLGNSFTPALVMGLWTQQHTPIGIFAYFFEVMGILPLVVLLGMLLMPRGGRCLVAIFMVPLLVGMVLQITPEYNSNHKFFNISVLLMDIIAADVLYSLLSRRTVLRNAVAVMLFLTLIVTGVFDFITLSNWPTKMSQWNSNTQEPFTVWLSQNTNPKGLFIVDGLYFFFNPVAMAGRLFYFNGDVYVTTAGYDLTSHQAITRAIFHSTDLAVVEALLKSNNIQYIIFNDGDGTGNPLIPNEALLKSHFKRIYQDSQKRQVYQTF